MTESAVQEQATFVHLFFGGDILLIIFRHRCNSIYIMLLYIYIKNKRIQFVIYKRVSPDNISKLIPA